MKTIGKIKILMEIAVIFAYEFMVAVIQVAAWVFRPNRGLQPAIVRMPTELSTPTSLWMFSMIISLTPGSLVVDLSHDNSVLYIHFFHAPDPDQLVATLRRRFEHRLHKIFDKEGR
ncbi:Na+/H+ antiporter subunit E [Bdellovibrio sp. HCB209]|uniref:Na+/H+ antiporter subunit E n=1 Tax=Bdellovibrio sp. HCB209 TaxID=3394354 RepID=UPI0039B5E5C9